MTLSTAVLCKVFAVKDISPPGERYCLDSKCGDNTGYSSYKVSLLLQDRNTPYHALCWQPALPRGLWTVSTYPAANPRQALPLCFWRRHRTDETMAAYSLAVTGLHTIIYLLCLVVFLLSKERCFKTVESRVQMNPYPICCYLYLYTLRAPSRPGYGAGPCCVQLLFCS